jgi:hypothetical protein
MLNENLFENLPHSAYSAIAHRFISNILQRHRLIQHIPRISTDSFCIFKEAHILGMQLFASTAFKRKLLQKMEWRTVGPKTSQEQIVKLF